jgi:predicted ATPase
MLQQLRIENFRVFRKLTVSGLKRVNLLVGKNNSGKTTVLEAVEALFVDQHPGRVLNLIVGRHDPVEVFGKSRKSPAAPLFHGQRLVPTSELSIEADESEVSHELHIRVVKVRADQLDLAWDHTLSEPVSDEGLLFEWRHGHEEYPRLAALGADGSLPLRPFFSGARMVGFHDYARLHFLRTEGAPLEQMQLIWAECVAARPDRKQIVIQFLQFLDERIRDIEFVAVSKSDQLLLGRDFECLVGIEDSEDHVTTFPLRQMGEGTARFLGLGLAVLSAESGTLLIDEIDTGLHHTVLEDMWRFVFRAAEEFNVQLFATTHSQDCWKALARVVADDSREDVSLQRIERDAEEAVTYSPGEIAASADYPAEVR